MGSSSAHHAVCALVSEWYVSFFVFISVLQSWVAARPDSHFPFCGFHQKLILIIFRLCFHCCVFTFCQLVQYTYMIGIAGNTRALLALVFSPHFFFVTFAHCDHSHKLTDGTNAVHWPRKLKTWTSFIKADPHVHREDTTVHIQLAFHIRLQVFRTNFSHVPDSLSTCCDLFFLGAPGCSNFTFGTEC